MLHTVCSREYVAQQGLEFKVGLKVFEVCPNPE